MEAYFKYRRIAVEEALQEEQFKKDEAMIAEALLKF
jgi:hypothetical protein